MATTTTNLGLSKPEYTDTADIAVINGNMDVVDASVGGMAAIVNGKQSTVAVSKGQYVLLVNSTITGLTDGAYTAAKAIPANTDLDSTYLTTVGNGGIANALNSDIASVPTTVREQLSSFNISGTSLSQLESLLSTQISSMSNNQIRIGRITGNYSGDQITRGATCIAVLYKQTSTTYHCFVLGTWVWGYYYSSSWHWTF